MDKEQQKRMAYSPADTPNWDNLIARCVIHPGLRLRSGYTSAMQVQVSPDWKNAFSGEQIQRIISFMYFSLIGTAGPKLTCEVEHRACLHKNIQQASKLLEAVHLLSNHTRYTRAKSMIFDEL